tara:strand:+ start:501 stop:2201 length:1701 start_codon:yes stop_codon:yes gene_type:complete
MNNTNPKDIPNMSKNIGEKINKIYQKSGYLEKYGGSLFFTMIIFGGYAIYKARLNILNNVEPIKNEWAAKRCSPGIIPFAGLINTPPGGSSFLFTTNNFSFCLKQILSTIVSSFFTPIYMIVSVFELTIRLLIRSVKNVKIFLESIQKFINGIFKMIADIIKKFSTPIMRLMYTFVDIMAKLSGIFSLVVNGLYATFLALKSIIAKILMDLVIVATALCILIVILWLVPFIGWPIAASLTVVAASLTVYISVLVHIARKIMGISVGAVIPLVPACFDKNTKLAMKNGKKKRIINIKVGDILQDGSRVTGRVKHILGDQKVYRLDGALVTENHTVVLKLNQDDSEDNNDINERHIPVKQHPLSELVEDYNEEYIYCINTTSKRIRINNTIYTDWDDLDEMDMVEIRSKYSKNGNNDVNGRISHSSIHKYLDGGFTKDTLIQLEDGRSIPITEIEANDVLVNGECVTGIVEIDGSNLGSQCSYQLSDDSDNIVKIKGGPNLVVYDDENLGIMQTLDINGEEIEKQDKLYHLITDKRTLSVNGIKFLDYNSCVEIYLEEDRTTLIYSLL